METFADWVQFSVSAAVVLLLLLIVALLLGLLRRRGESGHRKNGTTIRIEHLNEIYREHRNIILASILPSKSWNEHRKTEKQTLKAREKQLEDETRKRVFVVDFKGDIGATHTDALKDIVTALLQSATVKDEIVLRLESSGGLVHAYGLAASQLHRIKLRKIPLTVCVDRVAASGGYMMACVADKIIAAPFAILGSIGVISSVPNFHKLLNKHDVDYFEMTAGEFKRTLTPLGEVTDKKKEKHQEQIEEIHTLFKQHVETFRPGLDIAKVSTGEHWFGLQAIHLGLVDALQTSDDYLLEASEHAEVFLIEAEEKRNWKSKVMKQFSNLLSAKSDLIKNEPPLPRLEI